MSRTAAWSAPQFEDRAATFHLNFGEPFSVKVIQRRDIDAWPYCQRLNLKESSGEAIDMRYCRHCQVELGDSQPDWIKCLVAIKDNPARTTPTLLLNAVPMQRPVLPQQCRHFLDTTALHCDSSIDAAVAADIGPSRYVTSVHNKYWEGSLQRQC